MEVDTWQFADPLVWPALTSFRHYVELTCKMFARDGAELEIGIPGRTHKLDLLWPPVRRKLVEALGESWEEGFAEVDAAVEFLTAIDPDGQRLRFAITTKGLPSVAQDVYFDPARIMALIVAVEAVLGATEMALQAHLEYLADMRS